MEAKTATQRLGRLFGSRRFFIAATLGPAGVVLFMLTIYPFIMNVIYSLQSYELTKPKDRDSSALATTSTS